MSPEGQVLRNRITGNWDFGETHIPVTGIHRTWRIPRAILP